MSALSSNRFDIIGWPVCSMEVSLKPIRIKLVASGWAYLDEMALILMEPNV